MSNQSVSVKSRDAIRVWQFNFELPLCVSESSRRGLQQLQSSLQSITSLCGAPVWQVRLADDLQPRLTRCQCRIS